MQITKTIDWNSQKGRKYKQYNRAYYQEIIIKNDVEQRTQMLFKLKFLQQKIHIESVLQMYCQIDDLEQFANYIKMVDLSNKKMEMLFVDCLKNDSFKILFHIDQHYKINYNKDVIEALNASIKDS